MASKIDFYRLPRPVQDRFAAATRNAAPPAPLLFQRAPRTAAWVYLGASVGLLVIAVIVLCVGAGDVNSALALHGPKMLALDSVLLAAASYGVLHGAGVLAAFDAMPYRPGVYLFPGCVVDARGAPLEVWAMGDVGSIEALGPSTPGLSLRMNDGSRIAVQAPTAADAERALATLEPLRGELARAIADDDSRALSEFDPLHDRAMSSPIGPTEAMRRQVAPWIRFDWALAAALGVALGYGLGTARNVLSDRAMYRTVTAAATVADYRAYLAQGGVHADDVRDVLLPRALLAQAESAGTAAVQAFAEANKPSKIDAEIDAAMHRAMLAELRNAKHVGTLAALNAFAQQYPGSSVDAELAAARHAFFTQALASWKQKAQPDAATEAFFTRLLSWAEKNGPRSEVRFRREPSTSMNDADKSVQKSGHYPGPDALPSHYVTPDALGARETQVAGAITSAVTEAFSPDVLTMRAGEPLAPDAPPATSVPTLVIEYAPEWSRGNTACTKPNTVFAGLIFAFNVAFALPEGPPLKIGVKAWRGAAVWKTKPDGLSREDFEQKVYDSMIDGVFEQLEKKVRSVVL